MNEHEELDRKRKQVGESAPLFRELIDRSRDAIFVTDPETGRFIFVNRQACAGLGYSRRELLALRVGEMEATLPDEAAWQAHYQEILREGTIVLEGRHRRKDGSTFPVEVSVQLVTLDGGAFLVAVARDISARQRKEIIRDEYQDFVEELVRDRSAALAQANTALEDEVERRARAEREVRERLAREQVITRALEQQEALYRTLVEGASDSIFFIDPDCRIQSVNTAGARFLGRPAEELRGQRLLDVFGPSQGATYEKGIRQVLADGRVLVAQSELQVGGATRWLQTTLSPVLEPSQGPGGVIGVSRDVTEVRALELQLRQSQKMDALGRLAGGVAHDFNNLLTLIIGNAGFLAKTLEEGDPRREDALEIVQAGDRAALLTRQLLAFSRQQVIEPRRLSVHGTLGALERMLQRVVGEHIRLAVRLDAPRACVLASPGALDQILLNLVVNARDAMPEGGALTVGVREIRRLPAAGTGGEAAPRPVVEITVTDTGVGMGPEVLEHVFEPFFTTKPEGQGTGLGLATVYGIARQLGGDVQIQSTVGVGTAVQVLLPCTGYTSTELPAIDKPGLAATAPLLVLVAEDEAAVRRMIRRILATRSVQVIEAPDGVEALELVRGLDPPVDLVITDVVMPNLDGPGLARALRAQHPGLPVLFLSGYAPTDGLAELLAEPGTRLLGKPFDPEELLAEVAALVPR